jgi:hypothetical protein
MVVGLRRTVLRGMHRGALPVAVGLVLLPVAGLYGHDRWVFVEVCRDIGKPHVTRQVDQKGFLLVSGTANSFGMRYIEPGAFDWLEMADIYRKSEYVRFRRTSSGELTSEQIGEPTAEVEAIESFRQQEYGISVSSTVVKVRSTGEVLAEGARANFSGGRAKWVLGSWGASSCPSDGEDFKLYYRLIENTLGRR